MAGEWIDTEGVMRELKMSERTVQKWAARGHLRFKTVQNGLHRYRLYDVASVRQFRESGPQTKPPADITEEEFVEELRRPELPPPPSRRSSNFSLPEGKVSIAFPAQLSEQSTAQARTFIELVLGQL